MSRRSHPGETTSATATGRRSLRGVLAPAAVLALLNANPLEAGLDPPSLGDPTAGRLVGRVLTGRAPLGKAHVYVYDVADESKARTTTDRFGRYAFQPLAAGVYRVIAHRPGYTPAVAELTRTTAESVQSVDFELGARSSRARSATRDDDDFWSIRERIPADVLREIQIAEAVADNRHRAFETAIDQARFEAELRTLSGIEDLGQDAGARMIGSQLDLRSRFAETRLALRSDLREFEQPAFEAGAGDAPLGDSQAFALQLNRRGSNVELTSQRHRFRGRTTADRDEWRPRGATGLESYGLRVEQAAGGGASHFTARYEADHNFHHDFGGPYSDPTARERTTGAFASPMSSTTLEVSGGYERRMTARTSFETGVSYRERQAWTARGRANWREDPNERFDVFGRGDWEVEPAVVLQYGLLSTLRDGSLSFTPQAGFVIELGPHWSAEVSVSERVDSEPLLFRDFLPVQYRQDDTCGVTQEHCYRLELSRGLGSDADGQRVEFGASQRHYADSVRLYFSRDIFEGLESLLLVEGDQIAEVRFALEQRLGRGIRTRMSTSAANGGGGLLRTADSDLRLRNDVRYLVASVDTTFERSATGVLLAYRSVQQELSTLAREEARESEPPSPGAGLSVERLQLLLSQGLPWVNGLENWALQFEMQLSRGHVPVNPTLESDQLRRRVIAGIAVRF